MKRAITLTDDLLRDALSPVPGRFARDALLDAIASDVRRSPRRRGVLRALSSPGLAVDRSLDRRLVWMLAAAALLLAALAGAIVGGRMLQSRDPMPTELVPTGIEVLAADSGYTRVLVDGRGTTWATGPGHVTRLDASGAHRTWTVADDAAFADDPESAYLLGVRGSVVAPAKAGGIWVADEGRVLRFDGTGFRQELPAPPTDDVAFLAESPRGDLWAAGIEHGPWRWDGSAWRSAPAGRSQRSIKAMLVTGDDEVWLSQETDGDSVISHLTAGRWQLFDDTAVQPLWLAAAVAAAPDGTIWVSSPRGTSRFSDGSWSAVAPAPFAPSQLAATAGAVWALGAQDDELARFDGRAWARIPFDASAGRPTGVWAVGGEVWVTTETGILRRDGDAWVAGWTPSAAPGRPSALLATGASEAWAASGDALWHFAGGTWSGPVTPWKSAGSTYGVSIHGLALSPDRIVATGSEGISVLEGGIWTSISRSGPVAVAVAPDGSIWAASWDTGPMGLIHLRPVDGRWISERIACPRVGPYVVVAADGAVWTGDGAGYFGFAGLARYDGRKCTEVGAFGGSRVLDLVTVGSSVELLVQEGQAETATTRVVRVDPSGAVTPEPSLPVAAGGLAVDASGTLWMIGGLPGGRLTLWMRTQAGWQQAARPLDVRGPVSFAADGTLWFEGSSGIERVSRDRLVP